MGAKTKQLASFKECYFTEIRKVCAETHKEKNLLNLPDLRDIKKL